MQGLVWAAVCEQGDSSDGATAASLLQGLGSGVTRQGSSPQLPRSPELFWAGGTSSRKPWNVQSACTSRNLSTTISTPPSHPPKYLYTQKKYQDMPPERPGASLTGRIQNSRLVDYIWRAVRSAAYPIQGIWYFSKQGKFWPLWAGRLLPLSLVSLTVYLILFLFAYLPQVAFLAIWQGRGAWFSAMILTLGEGLVLIQALFEGFFVDEARVDVFDVGSLFLPTRKRP